MKKILGLCAIPLAFLTSCEPEETESTTFSKDGSIEINLSTKHYNDEKDILVIDVNVYKKGALISSKVGIDTVPSLGKIKTEGTDENGDTKEITIPKDYEFYVTAK